MHHTYDDFIEGDLGDRIEEYNKYKVLKVDIKDIDIDEFTLDYDLIEDYKETLLSNDKYPPDVLNSDYDIIDGSHRLNALDELGYTKVIAFVGLE